MVMARMTLGGAWRKQAFTLVELMIVVVIVAILAMVAIPLYRTSVNTARISEGIAGVGTIRTAFRVYAAGHDNEYPVLNTDGTGLDEINVTEDDLDGKFFSATDYDVVSTAATYTITATDPGTGLMYEIDQDGVETEGDDYYATGQE